MKSDHLRLLLKWKKSPLGVATIVILFLITSCLVHIEGTALGLTFGHKKLTEDDLKEIVFEDHSNTICNRAMDYKIHAITGKQLRECLKNNDTSLVYRWSPLCKAESCILIKACQEYCTKKNYKLYVVSEFYHMESMRAQNVADQPIFIANHKYYGKHLASKMETRFFKDVLNKPIDKEELWQGRYMIFSGDQFVKYRLNLYTNQGNG